MNASISWDESDARFSEYEDYLEEIQDTLSAQLPDLLKKTEFFRKVFYSTVRSTKD